MTQYFELDREVLVDRPAWQSSPRYPEVIYPLDYGHLTGTIAGDGGEVDVFIGSERGRGVVAVLLTVDLGKRDVETKILLDCTDHDIQLARQFCAGTLKVGGYLIARY